jgi:hypothetical protein
LVGLGEKRMVGKSLHIQIRPREDGKYFIKFYWGLGFNWNHGKTGLTQEELEKEILEMIRGTIQNKW